MVGQHCYSQKEAIESISKDERFKIIKIIREPNMDAEKTSQPLTFSYSAQATGASTKHTIDLDSLEVRHPGVKKFLSLSELTNSSIFIYPIKVSDLVANVYMVENKSGIKLVLKVLPRNFNHTDDSLTEVALTRVSSDIFVSPKYVQLRDNFILLPYIGTGKTHLFDAIPCLTSEKSFANVLKRLGMLHGTNIIPQKIAVTNFNKLDLLKSKELEKKQVTVDLNSLLEQINKAYSSSMAVATATPVFIHANMTPLNIVENIYESCLIDWGHAGQGNPYFDLGAVFAMYALEDKLKIKLIRNHYPNTIFNTLPEEDNVLLKELNLFSAIYWFNIALSVINTTVLDARQSIFLKGCHSNTHYIEPIINQQINLLTPLGQGKLIKSALCEAQMRLSMIEQLSNGNKLSF